jgi:hypothetical protein
MRFTNSPFEKMMQQVPRTLRPTPPKPRRGSPCAGCSYWNGAACVGVCYRELRVRNSPASGQLGPKRGK